MSFCFPLATVLRVRVAREQHEERALQQILQELSRAHASLSSLDVELLRVVQQRVEGAPLKAGREMHLSTRDVDDLRRWRREMEAQLEQLEEMKEQQLARYQSARQEREVLSELHSRQRSLYDVEAARREQRSIDDYFMARRLRRV